MTVWTLLIVLLGSTSVVTPVYNIESRAACQEAAEDVMSKGRGMVTVVCIPSKPMGLLP